MVGNKTVVLDAGQIADLNRCHAKTGAACYQSGYDDACDWMLVEIGIRESKFKTRPKAGSEGNFIDPTVRYSFPLKDGSFELNGTQYEMRLYRYSQPKSLDILNMTYANGTLRDGYRWIVTPKRRE